LPLFTLNTIEKANLLKLRRGSVQNTNVEGSAGRSDGLHRPKCLRWLPTVLGLMIVILGFALPANAPLDAQSPAAGVPVYLDPKQPIERRVDDLMSRMTLKEKVGQLNLPCVYVDELGKTIPEKLIACKRFAAGTYTNEIGPACGFFTLADTILHEGVKQQVEYFNELQKIALTQTRLKIPLLQDEEGTHGGMLTCRW
jgi:beta-glucosidase